MIIKKDNPHGGFISEFKNECAQINCPGFYYLMAVDGCPYQCSYCGYRNRDIIRYNDNDGMVKNINEWMERTKSPSLLRAGFSCNSLIYNDGSQLLEKIVPLFARQNKHVLLLTTKCADRNIDFLNNSNATDSVILSYNVGAYETFSDLEHRCPNPFERLAAAYTYRKRGWRVRVQIDPITPVTDHEHEYLKLCNNINMVAPERITLGTLRATPEMKKQYPGVFKYENITGPDNKLRLPKPVRESLYKWFVPKFFRNRLSLCMEEIDLIDRLGVSDKCNCMP